MGAPFIFLAAVVVLWALSRMGRMNRQQTRRFQRQLLGWGLGLVALFFLLHGNLLLGLPALAASAGLLGYAHLLPQGLQQGGASATASRPPAPPGNMDMAEALKVLGLQPGASADEIRQAHKRLQRANHPDAGGTDYLSGKINQARDILLRGQA